MSGDRADGRLRHDGIAERIRGADQDAIGPELSRRRVRCLSGGCRPRDALQWRGESKAVKRGRLRGESGRRRDTRVASRSLEAEGNHVDGPHRDRGLHQRVQRPGSRRPASRGTETSVIHLAEALARARARRRLPHEHRGARGPQRGDMDAARRERVPSVRPVRRRPASSAARPRAPPRRVALWVVWPPGASAAVAAPCGCGGTGRVPCSSASSRRARIPGGCRARRPLPVIPFGAAGRGTGAGAAPGRAAAARGLRVQSAARSPLAARSLGAGDPAGGAGRRAPPLRDS